MEFNLVEGLGTIATIFVLISFTQSNIKLIRVLNSIGSILFIFYGLYIDAFSVWFLNAAVLAVNCYKLCKYDFKDT